jgi:hypothetical protein
MQARDQFASGRRARLSRTATATAFAAVALISCSAGELLAQDVNRPAPPAPVAAAPAPVVPAPVATPAPVAQAAPAAAAPAPAATLPAVNVSGEKPKQKPVQPQRQVQGPRKEPIKIPVSSVGCKAARTAGKPYFVEFRSRTAVSYGHTFVFHGRLGEGNRFASFQIAGLHPKGDDPNVYLQGMMVPVESETGPSWGDQDEQYLTARFCVTLSEAEYRKALAYIKHLQATKKTWHATTYNCNAFAADIARHIGLDSPNPNMYLPESFIKRMADLNPRGKPSNPFSMNFSGFQQQQPAAQAVQPQRRTAQPRSAPQPQ